MTDRIKGLSIGLDLDTVQVERGLTGLKQSLKTVNSEMRANMSQFDKSDRSVGKYEKRLEGLNKKIEVQTKITSEAEKKYKDMVAQHGEGSKEAQRAAIEYNKQAAELNNLKSYTEGVTKELKALREEQRIANSSWTKTGQKIDETGKKMSAVGGNMQSVGKVWTTAVLGIGAAAAGVGVSLFALTNKVTENADSIAKGAKKMGVSTDFYQEMDYWASQNGISQDIMENSLKRLNQRMGEAANGNKKYSNALTKLGVNMDGVREGTVSTEDAFAQSIQSLSEMTSEQEKSALAAELFGSKMAQDLMPALQDGSLTIDEAKQKAEELGIVMSEDQLKAAEAFQDAQDDIKRAMGGVVNSIGLEVMPHFQRLLDWVLANMPQIRETIQNAMDQVIERISVFMKWWRELSDGAKRWIGIAAGAAIAVGPLLLAFGSALKIMGPLVSVFGQLSMWVGRVGGLMPALKIAFTALTGPVGITVAIIAALTAGFITAYRSSDIFRERVHAALDGAKKAFQMAIDFIKPVIENLVKQIKAFGDSILKFWNENKESIQQAVENIMSFVLDLLQGMFKIAKKFMPLIEMIFKNAWAVITLVFEVAKNTIMGIIQIFAGLFTGDTKKMIQGVKTIFSGGFKAIIDFFGSLKDNSLKLVSQLLGGFTSYVTNLKDNGINRIKVMRDDIVTRVTNLKDNFLSLGTNIRDSVTGHFTNLKDNTIKRVLDMRTEAVRRFTVMKDRFFDVGRDIRDNLKSRFDDMVTAAKELPGRIGDGIKNMASKATSGVKSFANSIGSTLETGINKVVGGMNNLLGKIGVSLTIPKINIPQYAKGTKNHPGGPAVVGEEGQELAHIPGKGYTILGLKGAELLNLPKGSSVLPNKETERLLTDGMGLPGYKTGVGRAFDWAKGKAQSGWQNAKSLASDAVGWLLDAPKKLFDKAMEFVGVSMPKADDFGGSIMRGSFTGLRDAVVEMLKGVQSEVSPGNPTFGAPFRMTSPFGWRTHPVLGTRRFHSGIDYAAPTGTPLLSQSAGTVSFNGWMGGYGNTVMVKSGMFDHLYAHNSRNIARTGQSISKGQLLGLVGSTGMSTGPHVHYEVRKNGKAINPKGFKTGGLIKEAMMTMLGDGGYPEYVIPTDPARATDAMKLLALAGRDIERNGGAKRPHQLPSVNFNEDNKVIELLKQLIEHLTKENEYSQKMIDLLMKLVDKDLIAVLETRSTAKGLYKDIREFIDRDEGRRRG
ncbi:peptidoglycan DD-metalloendopeptidase family protein [Bacillus sp. FJAT-45037]|uniref:peptidoglycan DD-metalloendopeptidase family protein n=1 Tax=Bacillus sp. FJAT-45037 TaxID=2011007 RepID=UPI000C249353|nr:peptidoglycan DD-metalloendopeptidase family protein [Bacillus sp. FJAT-45037]